MYWLFMYLRMQRVHTSTQTHKARCLLSAISGRQVRSAEVSVASEIRVSELLAGSQGAPKAASLVCAPAGLSPN